MNLENVRFLDERSEQAINELPEGVIDSKVRGQVSSILDYVGHGIDLIYFAVEGKLGKIAVLEGATGFFDDSTSEKNPQVMFTYKKTDYLFSGTVKSE